MGLFSKKKKTTVENIHKKVTLSKIVKLSYLQTLAINGGLDTVGNVAGETEAKSSTEDQPGSTKSGGFLSYFDKGLFALTGLPSIVNSLFGKKVSTSTKIDTKESGWTVSKTWLQPQFDIIRYAIGIKELTVAQFTYKETSEFISVPWSSPKEITKASVVVDQFIPPIFPAGTYIKYYIRPNVSTSDWIQINPLGLSSVFNEDGIVVPRIINFNTEKPISASFEDAYIVTPEPVKDLIFRAVMSRPAALENTTASPVGYTPILRSYRLLMYPKDGL
jgi:hypothetical protein